VVPTPPLTDQHATSMGIPPRRQGTKGGSREAPQAPLGAHAGVIGLGQRLQERLGKIKA
jgi:hypothetical protein